MSVLCNRFALVDSNSRNFYNVTTSSINFKAGEHSGTASKMSDEKNGSDAEYFYIEKKQEEDELKEKEEQMPQVDRSAQLNATLNSLAMLNVAQVINKNRHNKVSRQNPKEKKYIQRNLFFNNKNDME